MDVIERINFAYIGDAYYELIVRKHLLNKGLTNVNQLHKTAITFTSGEAQSKIMSYFIENNMLSEDEYTLFKRGRNASGPW